MRPILKSGLRRLWREPQVVQFGVDSRRAVAVSGVDESGEIVLDLLDGSREITGVVAAAKARGVAAEHTHRLLETLLAGGAVDDHRVAGQCCCPVPGRCTPPCPERSRLAGDLAALSLVRGGDDGGVRTLARRHQAAVRVCGGGKVGAPLAALLAASGVGLVVVDDPEPARPHDVTPGGLEWADVGRPRGAAAARAARRAAPGARVGDGRRAGEVQLPDIAVLTSPTGPWPITTPGAGPGRGPAAGPPGTPPGGAAVEPGPPTVPYIRVAAREAIGVVGPLVIPGRTTCPRCIDLARRDRDPAWAVIAAQAGGPDPGPPACDVVLAAAVAAQAAAQVLAFVDGSTPAPAALNGTLEIVSPDWRWRRSSWEVHPECGCMKN